MSTQYYPRYGIQKEDQLLCKILEEGGRLPSREEVEGGKLKHLFCQNYDFYEVRHCDCLGQCQVIFFLTIPSWIVVFVLTESF